MAPAGEQSPCGGIQRNLTARGEDPGHDADPVRRRHGRHQAAGLGHGVGKLPLPCRPSARPRPHRLAAAARAVRPQPRVRDLRSGARFGRPAGGAGSRRGDGGQGGDERADPVGHRRDDARRLAPPGDAGPRHGRPARADAGGPARAALSRRLDADQRHLPRPLDDRRRRDRRGRIRRAGDRPGDHDVRQRRHGDGARRPGRGADPGRLARHARRDRRCDLFHHSAVAGAAGDGDRQGGRVRPGLVSQRRQRRAHGGGLADRDGAAAAGGDGPHGDDARCGGKLAVLSLAFLASLGFLLFILATGTVLSLFSLGLDVAPAQQRSEEAAGAAT